MACLRLLTAPPLPPFPRLSVPVFRLRIAFSTVFEAPFEYFLAIVLLHPVKSAERAAPVSPALSSLRSPLRGIPQVDRTTFLCPTNAAQGLMSPHQAI